MDHFFLAYLIPAAQPQLQQQQQQTQRRRRGVWPSTIMILLAAAALMCLSSVVVRPVSASSAAAGVVIVATTEEGSAAAAAAAGGSDGGPIRSEVGDPVIMTSGSAPNSRRRLATDCRQYDGYTAYRDVDRDGEDIGDYDSASNAFSACNRMSSCVGFNSEGWVKRSATPLTPHGDLCFYVKTSSAVAPSGGCAGGQAAQASQGSSRSIRQALVDVINDYCFVNSGARCDEIDFTGGTDWYREYFSAFPPLSNRTCNTNLVLTTATGAPRASQRSTMACRPNPMGEGVCTLAARLDSSSSATVTQGTGYSDQFKAGIVTKIKASFGSMETTMESTFDFAFSSSEQDSTAKIIGQAMGATVSVSTSPTDRRCTSLIVSLGRAATIGKLDVYLELYGGVGTRQNDWRAWKNINKGRNDYKYVYHSLSYIVDNAKAANSARASAFSVVGNAVRVTIPVTIDMQVPVYSYVNPQQYDLSSEVCLSSARTSDFVIESSGPPPRQAPRPPPLRPPPRPPLRPPPRAPLLRTPPGPSLLRTPPGPPLRTPPRPPLLRTPPKPPLRLPPRPPLLRTPPRPPLLRTPPRLPPRPLAIRSRMAVADTAAAIDATDAVTATSVTMTAMTTKPSMLDESSSFNISAEVQQSSTRTQQTLSGPQVATQLSTRSASVSSIAASVSPVLMQRLEALVHAYCRAQSGGDDCEVDWDGETDWWRTYFLRLPSAQLDTGLDPPVWNQTASGLENMTSGLVVCPYRPFNYKCQVDAHSYQSRVITRAQTATQNYGITNKVQVLFGADLSSWGLVGLQSGFTFSASSSYSWSEGTATANTETATTIQTFSVQMNPVANPTQKCAHLMTNISVASVRGTQHAWVTINGYVGFHHDRSRVWKKWSTSTSHYYRAQTFSSVISYAKSLMLKEADEWTMVDGVARIQVPIDVVVMTGVRGSSGAVYYTAGSQQCNLPEPV